jgi:hypothetical protein
VGRLWARCGHGIGLGPESEFRRTVTVSPNALLPGDLAVWDSHVVKIVGNGMMVEATA